MFATHGALTKHQHQIEGINSRMDGLQAAILTAKLPHILEWTASRIEKAKWYESTLKEIPQIVLPNVMPNSKHTFHLYVIRAQRRDELAGYLKENGIETAIHYPTPLPLLQAYAERGFTEEQFPVASQYQHEILSLPIYPELTTQQINKITQTIKSFYGKYSQ